MSRRILGFFCLLITVLLITGSVEAQQPGKVPRIGFLSTLSRSNAEPWEQAFRQGLRDLGWIEGKNITFESRYSDRRDDRLPELAADLVRLNGDVIVASFTPDTLAAKNATREIPIVMASVSDPVESRFVDSLARPRRNITGLTNLAQELSGKRLERSRKVFPSSLVSRCFGIRMLRSRH